jgi:hypothetical protein
MDLKVEVAVAQLNKGGEELCGDVVELVEGESTIAVLSDGLGSGVKAHILSSLTAKMAATMLTGVNGFTTSPLTSSTSTRITCSSTAATGLKMFAGNFWYPMY